MQLAQDLLQLDVTTLPDVDGVVSDPHARFLCSPTDVYSLQQRRGEVGVADWDEGHHRRWTVVFGHEPPCYDVPSGQT